MPLPQTVSYLKIDITFDDSMEESELQDDQAKTVPATFDEGQFNPTSSGFTPPHYYLASQSHSPQ